jgi:hypothetical protein
MRLKLPSPSDRRRRLRRRRSIEPMNMYSVVTCPSSTSWWSGKVCFLEWCGEEDLDVSAL